MGKICKSVLHIMLILIIGLAVTGCNIMGDDGEEQEEVTFLSLNPSVASHGNYRFDSYGLEWDERESNYQEEFVTELNTYIFGQLLILHDDPGSDLPVTLRHKYLKDGSTFHEYTTDYTVSPGYSGTIFTYGLAINGELGSWEPGNYTQITYDDASGEELSRSEFSVVVFATAPFTPQLVGTGTPSGWPDDAGFTDGDQTMTKVSENKWTYSWDVTEATDLAIKIRETGNWNFAYTNDEDPITLEETFQAYVGQDRGNTEVSVPGAGTITVTLWFTGENEDNPAEMKIEFTPEP